MPTHEPVCQLCGAPAEPVDPLVPDEFYGESLLHLHCLNSPGGAAWIQARCDADPLYARYWSLINVGEPVACASCGSLESISPKASGMAAGHWEVGCSACHRYLPLLNAYRSPPEDDLFERLSLLSIDFKVGRAPERVLEIIGRLAREADRGFRERCACGASYSLAARPRCTRCQGVLIDTPFHFTMARSAADH